MAKERIVILLTAALVIFTGRSVLAQPMTADEIIAIVETPDFQSSMTACAAGPDHPKMVKLSILVNVDGSATLNTVEPSVAPETRHCIGVAVVSLKFKGWEQSYAIEYDYVFAEAPAPVEAPPALPQPAPPVHPPVKAQPAPPPVAETQPVQSPGGKTQFRNEPWQEEYRAGKRMVGIGIAMTVLGGGVLIGSAVYVLATFLSCVVNRGGLCQFDRTNWTAFIIVDLAAFACLGLGIGLLVTGIVKRRRANRMKKNMQFSGLSISPAFEYSGAVLSAAWRF